MILPGDSQWMILQADCRDVLPTLADDSVAHVITDPPYDARTVAGARSLAKLGERVIAFDGLVQVGEYVDQWLRVARRWCLAFCALEQLGDYQTAAGPAYIRGGVFRAPNRAPQFSGDRPAQPAEGLAILHRKGRKKWNGRGRHAYWQHNKDRAVKRDQHPTPKPLSLMLELVEQFTEVGDVVLDPFCGSGTTGVACLRLGRRFIGVEAHQPYAVLAADRLVAEVERQIGSAA